MPKWGKIGAPKSQKRKEHLARIRKRKGKKAGSSPARKAKPKRRTYMPRKKKGTRRKKTVSLAVLLGTLMPLAEAGIYAFKTHGLERVPAALLSKITGYDIVNQDFSMQRLLSFLLPLGIGVAVHKLASMTGVNRMLGRAGIPLVRI